VHRSGGARGGLGLGNERIPGGEDDSTLLTQGRAKKREPQTGKPTLDQEATMDANMNKRWMAEIYYQNGLSPQIVAFEELEELQEIVERGPDWNDIEKIEVHLNRRLPRCPRYP
jgi:hypothetical protein